MADDAPIDLNLLSVFVVVAQGAGFSAAAEKLGLERSSISRSVATLERQLGVQLFSRTTRKVSLTTAGTALYAKVAPQLASIADALGTLPEREEEPSGALRLSVSNDFATALLPDIAAAFSLRYPAVTMDVRVTNRVVDLVGEGIDAALRLTAGPLDDSTLVARRLAALQIHVYAAPVYLARAGTPRTPADTAAHAWVQLRGHKLPPPLPRKGVRARVVADDMLFATQAVRAGLGLGLLPSFLVRGECVAGHLTRVLPRVTFDGGALYFVHPAASHVPRKVTALRDYLVEHFAAHPLTKRP